MGGGGGYWSVGGVVASLEVCGQRPGAVDRGVSRCSRVQPARRGWRGRHRQPWGDSPAR